MYKIWYELIISKTIDYWHKLLPCTLDGSNSSTVLDTSTFLIADIYPFVVPQFLVFSVEASIIER